MSRFQSWASRQSTDPIAQALNVYTTLKGAKHADEEMALKRDANTRAMAADERAGQESTMRLAQGQQAIDFSKAEHGRKVKDWSDQDALRQTYADEHSQVAANMAQLQAGNGKQISVEGLEGILGSRGGLNVGKQEKPEALMASYANVTSFFEQLPELGLKQPVSIPRTPQFESMFQSLERLSADRKGAVHPYQALDENGRLVEREGTVGQIVNVYFDPQTDTVSVGMSVVDPETGALLLGKDGAPIVVPATEQRSANPEDPIKRVPRAQLVESANLGAATNAAVLKEVGGRSKPQQDLFVALGRARYGDPAAIAEVKALKGTLAQIDALRQSALSTKDPLAKEQMLRSAELLEQGVSLEDAKGMVSLATRAKTAARELAAEEKREAREHARALELEARKGENEQAKQRLANEGDLNEVALRVKGDDTNQERETKKAVEAYYKGAAAQLVRAKTAAERNRSIEEKDPMSPFARRLAAAKTPEAQAELRADFVARDEGVRAAEANFLDAKARMEVEGLLEKQSGADVDLNSFLSGGAQPPPAIAPSGGAIPMQPAHGGKAPAPLPAPPSTAPVARPPAPPVAGVDPDPSKWNVVQRGSTLFIMTPKGPIPMTEDQMEAWQQTPQGQGMTSSALEKIGRAIPDGDPTRRKGALQGSFVRGAPR